MKIIMWYIASFAIIILCVISFTPIVIPHGYSQPWVLGMPRTLWVGILISISILFLLIFAAIGSTNSLSEGED